MEENINNSKEYLNCEQNPDGNEQLNTSYLLHCVDALSSSY